MLKFEKHIRRSVRDIEISNMDSVMVGKALIIKGEPVSNKVLEKIAKYLECSIGDLIEYE